MYRTTADSSVREMRNHHGITQLATSGRRWNLQMMNGSKTYGLSGAKSKAEMARTAGVPFPLTPTLSPRRGGNIPPRCDNTSELGCRETREKEAGTATAICEISRTVPMLSLSSGSSGRGLG